MRVCKHGNRFDNSFVRALILLGIGCKRRNGYGVADGSLLTSLYRNLIAYMVQIMPDIRLVTSRLAYST